MRLNRWLKVLILIGFLHSGLPGQDLDVDQMPDSVLRKAANKYRDLDRCTIEFFRTAETQHSRLAVHRRISFVRPGRLRSEDLTPPKEIGRAHV